MHRIGMFCLTALCCTSALFLFTGAADNPAVTVNAPTLKISESESLRVSSAAAPAPEEPRLFPQKEKEPAVRQKEEKPQEPKKPPASDYYIPEIALSQELQRYTYLLCREYGVDYDLILSMMFNESCFDPDARRTYQNGTADSGILQINTCNLDWLSKEHKINDLQDPYQNILAGLVILSQKIEKYGEHDGLMAYNMGDGGYLKAKKNGVTSTHYVKKILKDKAVFQKMQRAK